MFYLPEEFPEKKEGLYFEFIDMQFVNLIIPAGPEEHPMR